MGRISDLLEKKALGDISADEQKELDTLLKEAAMADEVTKKTDTADASDDAIDTMAQKLADSAQEKLNPTIEKLISSIDKLGEHKEVEASHDKGFSFAIDKELGKAHSVADLAEIKIELPGRKAIGKKETEVSQKTVEFFTALYASDKQKLQVLSEGTATDGGYLVPEEFANVLIEDIRDINVMRQLASVMSITTDTVHIPTLTGRPKAAWRSEKATKNTSTASFSENVLTPYSLASIVSLSNELVADASLGVGGSIVNYIAGLMSTALAEAEEDAFWNGNGSGKPTGIDNYSLRTVNAGAGASDVQKADAILNAYHNTPQGYRNKAVWVGSMSAWFEVGRLKDTQNRYLLEDLAGSPTRTLRGRPVYESAFVQQGKLFFGDFSYYQIVDREGISVRISDEATVAGQSAFERNLTHVRVEKRVDAELLLPAAVTEVQGLGTP